MDIAARSFFPARASPCRGKVAVTEGRCGVNRSGNPRYRFYNYQEFSFGKCRVESLAVAWEETRAMMSGCDRKAEPTRQDGLAISISGKGATNSVSWWDISTPSNAGNVAFLRGGANGQKTRQLLGQLKAAGFWTEANGSTGSG